MDNLFKLTIQKSGKKALIRLMCGYKVKDPQTFARNLKEFDKKSV